jgi:hypothetical protein
MPPLNAHPKNAGKMMAQKANVILNASPNSSAANSPPRSSFLDDDAEM